MAEMEIEERASIREELLGEGEKLSDLIVDSYRAYGEFKLCYDDFVPSRTESQSLCKKITKIIESSSKNNETIQSIIDGLKRAENSVQVIPDPHWNLAATIGATVSTLALKAFGHNYRAEDTTNVKFEIRRVFQKDIHSTIQVYLKGVECTSKFEETCRAISNFHRFIPNRILSGIIEDKFVLEFLKEISDYNPSNVSVYPKILRRAYERLIENTTTSEEGRRLTKVFEVIPDAVSVIDVLNWRFDSEGYDSGMTQVLRNKILEYFRTDTYNRCFFLYDVGNCYEVSEKERVILKKNTESLLNRK